ncbi:MAG: CarD family transcriptional regulator, partial [Spirochaeta sp.]
MKTLLFDALSRQLKGNRQLTQLDSTLMGESWPVQVAGLQGSFLTYYLARIVKNRSQSMIIVVPSEREVDDLVRDLGTLGVNAMGFPWYGTMPYHPVPENSSVHGTRMRILAHLCRSQNHRTSKNAPFVCVTSMRAAVSPVPPPEWISDHLHTIQRGQEFDPTRIARLLSDYGYSRVSRVSIRGEFALRGEVLDIYPPGSEYAVRVVFAFDTIEDIRGFDPATQTSIESLARFSIYPVKEVIWEDGRIDALSARLRSLLEFPGDGVQLIEHLYETRTIEREEVFFPLSFPSLTSILDYADSRTLVVLSEYERLHSAAEGIGKEFESLHRKTRTEGNFPLPENLLIPFSDIEARVDRVLRCILLTGKYSPDIRISYDGPRSFFGNIEFLHEEIHNLQQSGYRILVGAETTSQAERISHLLQESDVQVIPETLQGGFTLPEAKLAVLQENEIFGRRKRTPASVQKTPSQAIETFVELEPGDLVVHVNYGIGLFRGIQRMRASGNERDYIHLEYAGEEFIYIPIEQVNLIQRYIGQQGSVPRLDKIGGKSWESRKNKVRKSVEDLAERLVELYSKRKQARGYAFPPDTDWQIE